MNNHMLETKNGSDSDYLPLIDLNEIYKQIIYDFTQFLGKKTVAGNYRNRFFYSAFDIFDKKGLNKINEYINDYPFSTVKSFMLKMNHDPSIILHLHGKQPTSMNNHYTLYCGNLHIRVYGEFTENINLLPSVNITDKDYPFEILRMIFFILKVYDLSSNDKKPLPIITNDILVYNKELLETKFLPEGYFNMFLDFFPSVIKKLY